MILIVLFDLPTITAAERRAASIFREKLLKDGFSMLQLSVYMHLCHSQENADVHIKRVEANLLEYGDVLIFNLTDVQFGRRIHFVGRKPKEDTHGYQQLTIF